MSHAEFEKLKVPGPTVTAMSRPFWDATAAGSFRLQRCDDCSRWVFYPRSHCPRCWSPHLSWGEASGRGRLKSYTVVHRAGHPAWEAVAPYALGLVELDEGPTMLATLVDVDAADLKIGMPLLVRHVRIGDYVLPMFTAAPGASQSE
jgi:uncharacterized OB-fold protein